MKRIPTWGSLAVVCALVAMSCAGDEQGSRGIGRAEPVGTARLADVTEAEPTKSHLFLDFKPSAHIEPSTARDYLPGTGEVGPDGSYHYSLPLDVPAGRGDVTPRLSLEYSSRAGNGALGVGWGVGGLSTIHPCGSIVALDGIVAEADQFCLDGARLVEVAANEFRTEHDQIAKIVRLTADPDFAWKVQLKDHRIRYYAKPSLPSNDWPLAEERDRSGNFARYAYGYGTPRLIESIKYTFHGSGAAAQREVVFHYAEREDKIARRTHGQLYRWDERLETIEMLAPNPDTKEVVWSYALEYTQSPDTGYSRLTGVERRAATGGHTFSRNFRWSEPPTGATDGAFTRPSSVPSAPIAERSPLFVADFDGDGTDDVVYGADLSANWIVHWGSHHDAGGPLASSDMLPVLGDVTLTQPVDIDGDGASEIVTMVTHGTAEDRAAADTYAEVQAIYRYEVWRWNAATHAFEIVPGVLPANAATLAPDAALDPSCRWGDAFARCEHLFFADVNGDALPDIVKPWDDVIDNNYQPTKFEIYLNTHGTFASPISMPLSLAPSERIAYHSWFFATVHDGRQYVRYLRGPRVPEGSPFHDDGWAVGLRADGTPETFTSGTRPPWDGSRPKPLEMDADGDGVRVIDWLTDADPWYSKEMIPYRADVDGDGREDVIVHNKVDQTIEIHLSKTLADSPDPVFELAYTLTHDRDLKKVVPGDFDGDGRVDVGAIDDNGGFVVWRQRRGEGTSGGFGPHAFDVDLLTMVSDADHYAPREIVLYRRVDPILVAGETHPGPPDLGPPPEPSCSAASYPTACVRRGGLNVVSRHARLQPRSDDPDAMRTVGYDYFYPSVDLHGRGFLGFNMIRTWEAEGAVETETTFRNDERVGTAYPYAFLPAKVTTATLVGDVRPNGRLAIPDSGTGRVVLTQNSYTRRALSGSTYAVFNERTDTFVWEEEVKVGAWELSVEWPFDHISGIDASPQEAPRHHSVDPTYDDYGNVTAQTAITTNGVRSEFTLDPEPPNTTAWLVDLPADYKYRSWTPTLHGPPSFRHIRFQHDTRGRLIAQQVEPMSTDADLKQTITYVRDPAHGSYGQVTGIIQSAPGIAGGTRVAGVDWHDWTGEEIFPALTWNGLSHTTTRIHHPAYGVVVAEASADGVEVVYDHDDLGRPRRTTPQGGDAVELTYREQFTVAWDLEKLAVEATTASGDSRTTIVDALGRPVRTLVRGMDGWPKAMSTSYDVLGRPFEIANWGAWTPSLDKTVQRYDTLGRPRSVTRPDGTVLETEYVGLFESVHYDAKRAKKRQIRDADDRPIETYAVVEGTEVLSSSIVYKPFDLPGVVRDADRNPTELFYDALGRKHREDDPNTGTTRYYHNGLGELRREERGPGTADAVVYHRDALGRVETMDTADGTVTWSWDATNGTGKLNKETNFDGTAVQYRYDDQSRLSGSSWVVAGGSESFDLDVRRDEYGRVTKTLYPDTGGGQRLAIEQEFKGAYVERIVDVTDPAHRKALWTIRGRTSDGALQRGTFGDAVATYDAWHDTMGRPSRIQARRWTTEVLMDLEVTPDDNGNVRRREDHAAHRVETFDYDELYRLRHWSNTSGSVTVAREFRYDPIGNLEKVLNGATVLEDFVDGGAAGPQKLDHSLGGVTYAYDHRGRQTRAGSRRTTYNAFDLPRTVQNGSSGWSYEYTAAGDRFRKRDTLGILETVYIDRLYERQRAGTQTTHVHHVYGPDGAVADVIVSASGRRVSYLVGDVLGSTTVRFDDAASPSGRPERLHYEPFGGRINADGSAWTGAWGASRNGFTGAEHDEPGLVNLGGRIYDPAQRRFITPDPFVSDPLNDQAWHRYSYVRNNPATLTDPTGYWVPPAWLCGGAGPVGFTFGDYTVGPAVGSYNVGRDLPPAVVAYAGVPEVTPDGYRGPASLSTPSLFSGTGYGGGEGVARWLIDNGVDAWLQQNGDAAIEVALGTAYVAATLASLGAASQAGVFVGAGARVASFGTRSWRVITGVSSGAIGAGGRRYGNQASQWGARGIQSGTSGISLNSSSAAMGVERASPALLAAIQRHGRTIQIAAEGTEELRYLNYIGAEANVGGPNLTNILLRPDPSKAAVLEEFLHGTQWRLGVIQRLGVQGAETHVKSFMIRHGRMLGLGTEDIAALRRLMEAGL